MSAQPPAGASPRFRPLSEMPPRCVEWLWPLRLGLGKLAILEGDPGLGKSFVALDLCARLSTGRPWPDGAPAPPPAACVYLNGEDGEDTLGPRLQALGGDPGRVFLLDREEDELAATLSLPAEVDALEAAVVRAQARLVVIDPITPFFSAGVNLASDLSVRRALRPLAALARRQACHVLLLRHLNKVGRGRAVYRGLGSIGLVGASRSAWLVAEEAEGSGRRVLAQVKNNLAPIQPSLAFEVVQPEGAGATLNWLGPVAATARDLLGPPPRRRRPEQRDAACEFLERVLADGPLTVNEVWDRARAEELSSGTVRRAKTKVKVRSEWATVEGRAVSYWMLKDQKLPPEIKPQREPEQWELLERELDATYPPRTPLEDDD